jgi:hypothetical protein
MRKIGVNAKCAQDVLFVWQAGEMGQIVAVLASCLGATFGNAEKTENGFALQASWQSGFDAWTEFWREMG